MSISNVLSIFPTTISEHTECRPAFMPIGTIAFAWARWASQALSPSSTTTRLQYSSASLTSRVILHIKMSCRQNRKNSEILFRICAGTRIVSFVDTRIPANASVIATTRKQICGLTLRAGASSVVWLQRSRPKPQCNRCSNV